MSKLKLIIIFILLSSLLVGETSCMKSGSKSEEISLDTEDKFPNIEWITITGEKIRIADLKDCWLIICCWYSCLPQREAIQAINSIRNEYCFNDMKVIILQDDFYQQSDLETYLAKDNPKIYATVDSKRLLSDYYPSVSGKKPIYFLIDTCGILRNVYIGSFPIGNDTEDSIKTFLHDAIVVKITKVFERGIGQVRICWETDKAVFSYMEIGICDGLIGCRNDWETGKSVFSYREIPFLCIQSTHDTTDTKHHVIIDDRPNTTYTFRISVNKIPDRITSKTFQFSTPRGLPLTDNYELIMLP